MEYHHIAQQIITDIDSAVVKNNPSKHRRHLGASEIGDECLRKLWFKFRWVKTIRFNGRMLRLFDRGHREEEVFIRLLRDAGWKIFEQDDVTGNQFRFEAFEGHFGGSLDGIGIPPEHLGLPARVLLEFKTANKNSTSKLMKDGVRQEKPRHWAQQHLYGAFYQLPVSVYISVNKDNDDLVCEVFDIELSVAEDMLFKAESVIYAQEMPPGISSDPTFWICRFCDYKKICHEKAEPERNCRSCRHAKPGPQAMWRCTAHENVEIPEDQIVKEQPCWENIINASS